MRLPATDLGIMAEHLTTHEGMINKFKLYYTKARNMELRNLLSTHIQVLRNHVRVMLMLIDPAQKEPVQLHRFDDIQLSLGYHQFSKQEKDIILEAKASAKLMASNNFMSALMMKDPNVKQVHIEMAIQEVQLQALYDQIIEHMNWIFTPKVTEQMQLTTLQEYYHLLNE
ncbi:spore coat protein [Salinibacillus xinjiangensis]|uniref:Spore coat protein n=1 Tax=Salinibacillus xinjiangensis TaxID=1229268 RepID=A0A6G1X7C1_9BACI|nr:spore coat protein [Salinibacillus xinjiangensis]MRG86864.1 hypothetical protein [Salinibacillus xinjiangensis]